MFLLFFHQNSSSRNASRYSSIRSKLTNTILLTWYTALASFAIRDYDNLEEKQLLDVLSTFVMADDTGLLCDAYNTAALGEKDCTRISVMEKKRFPAWLAEHENTLKSISDF